MRYFLFLFLPFLTIPASAQLYTNASNNLPDNGARGPSMDVRTADIDGDGDLDIILANEFQANTILLNDGSGNFTNGTFNNIPQPINDSEDVAIADFNQDGHLDLVFCSEDDITLGQMNVHEYYLGDGTGKFTTAPHQLPDSEANAVITADINQDSLPDLLFGNNGPTGLLLNNGDGTFTVNTDRIPAVNRTTQDLAIADVDGDGDMDLMEGNENGNVLFINDGNGFFTDESATRLPQGLNIETRKITFGDIDGDDDVDIFLSNVVFIPGRNPQNRLLKNNGSGNFSDATLSQLPADSDHTIDAIFEDIDLDSDLDLVVANVFGGPIKIYENDGTGNFSNATVAVLGQNYVQDALGVIAADLNGDGWRDLYICDRFIPQNNGKDLLLLRNIPTATESLSPKGGVIQLFPNPANDQLRIQLPQPGIVIKTLVLLDQQGRKASRFETFKSIGYYLSVLHKTFTAKPGYVLGKGQRSNAAANNHALNQRIKVTSPFINTDSPLMSVASTK